MNLNKLILTILYSLIFASSSLNASAIYTLIELPMNIIQAAVFTVGMTLMIPFYVASIVYDGYRDVTRDKGFENISYRTYSLREDKIYYQYCRDHKFNLKEVGHFRNYLGTEDCKSYFVESGTRLKIYKIFRFKGLGLLSGGNIKVIAVIEDGDLKGYMVDIGEWLNESHKSDNNINEMDSSKLESTSSSIKVDVSTGSEGLSEPALHL